MDAAVLHRPGGPLVASPVPPSRSAPRFVDRGVEAPMNIQFKEQRCNVVGLALSWIAYGAALAYFSYQCQWIAGLLCLVGVPALRWALFRFFPQISRFLGYGRIVDNLAAIGTPHATDR